MYLHTFIITVLALTLGATSAFAHGEGGTIEELKDGYLIDIGYSTKVLEVDTQIRFDFLLFDTENGSEVDFDEVWVRVSNDKGVYFAGSIPAPEYGDTGFVYRFAEGGVYTLSVRYENGEGEIVATDAALLIEQGDKPVGDGRFSGKALLFVALLSFSLSAVFFGVARECIYFITRLQSGRPAVTVPKQSLKSVARATDFISHHKEVLVNVSVSILVAIVTFFIASFALGVLDGKKVELPVFSASDFFGSKSVQDGEVVEVVLHDGGYEPRELTIPLGTTVRFSTTVDRPHWPASNLHPSHDIYPEFDPQMPVQATDTWEFTFDELGSWKFHDHIRSYYTGVVYVKE